MDLQKDLEQCMGSREQLELKRAETSKMLENININLCRFDGVIQYLNEKIAEENKNKKEKK